MQIKIKPEVDEKVKEAIAILRSVGLRVQEPIQVDIETRTVRGLGSELPVQFIQAAKGRFEFIIPDDLLEK